MGRAPPRLALARADHRHAGVREATATRSCAARCRTATSPSSIRRARCRCSPRRRSSATRATSTRTGATFETLMAACGVALLIALAFARRVAGRSGRRGCRSARRSRRVAPLLLGSVVLTRFDLWPAALIAGAMAALLSGRLRLGHGLLGAGVVAKIWPGVLLPLTVAYVWRTRGRREALVCLGIAAGRRRRGRAAVLRDLAARRLDELLAPALAAAADREHRRRADRRLAPRLRHRRDDGLEPRLAEHRRRRSRAPSACVQSVVQLGVLVGIWIAFARRDRVARGAGAVTRPRRSSRSSRSGRCCRRSS